MRTISSINELSKILGDAIVAQTGLNKKYVLNGKSLYGANRETITNYIAETFTNSDSYVVFTIDADDTSDNMTEETVDKHIDVYDSYLCTIMCYGEHHNELAIKINARFLTEEVLRQLHQQGVHIQAIDLSKTYSDFVNDVLVDRRDVMVHIACQFDIDKLDNDDYMSSFDSFTIKTV